MSVTASAPAPLASTDDASLSLVHPKLLSWFASGTRLAFVYSRSMGGLIATGRATIAALDSDSLRLRTPDGHLLVTTSAASYSTDPQLFFFSNFLRSALVPGLAVQLQSHDWLFLSESVPADRPGKQLPELPQALE